MVTESASETKAFGKRLAASLIPGIVICLYGDLGVGKTVLVQGIASGLGVKELPTSPTFVFLREYKATKTPVKRFYHLDLYRIQHANEVKTLGIADYLIDKEAIMVIEWAEKLGRLLPEKRLEVNIRNAGGETRRILVGKSPKS